MPVTPSSRSALAVLIVSSLVALAGCTATSEPAAAPDAAAPADVQASPDATADPAETGAEAETETSAEPDPGSTAPETWAALTEDGAITYANTESTSRTVKYRLWFPEGFEGAAAVIIVSHGGSGSTQGHTRFQHLGQEYATHGFVAIHLNHAASANGYQHRLDRPHDVSAIIDALEDGTIAPPAGFGGTFDLSRIGHIGHSWGAYTAHAVAGGTFLQGVLRDDRIQAITALSPQGWDAFGSYDAVHDIQLPSDDNTWMTVRIPAFNVIGELEMDRQATANGYMGEKWRLYPFARYPTEGDKLVSVLAGQNHGDIGNSGPPEVKTYIAANTRLFFEVYLRGQADEVCSVGLLASDEGVTHERKPDPEAGLLAACP